MNSKVRKFIFNDDGCEVTFNFGIKVRKAFGHVIMRLLWQEKVIIRQFRESFGADYETLKPKLWTRVINFEVIENYKVPLCLCYFDFQCCFPSNLNQFPYAYVISNEYIKRALDRRVLEH